MKYKIRNEQHDREIAEIRRLVRISKRMLVGIEKSQKRIDRMSKELRASQKETARMVKS